MSARAIALALLLLSAAACTNPCARPVRPPPPPPPGTTTTTTTTPTPTPRIAIVPARAQRVHRTYPTFERAIHVVFDHEPGPLIQRVLALSGSGPSCRQSVASIVSSGPQEATVEFMNTLVPMGMLEPSFGCRVLTEVNATTLPPQRRPPRQYLRFWVLRLPPSTTDGVLVQFSEAIGARPGIARATPVPTARPPADPFVGEDATNTRTPDTELGTQWYLHQCKVPELKEKISPVVAVLDFGFRTTHQELKGTLNMKMAFNSCDLGTDVAWGAERYHGTGVAGLLAAVMDGVGMQGVAPGVEVWPIQGTCASPSEGIHWAMAVEHVRAANSDGRRKVVLLEVQTGAEENYESDPAVNVAIQAAVASDVIVVMPAGNGGMDAAKTNKNVPIPPSGAILVGGTVYGAPDSAADFSNSGERVLVWAPGDPSWDLTISDEEDFAYTTALGYTSGAAPKVAGVVARMLHQNPALSDAEVKQILSEAGGDVVGEKGKQLDATAALERVPASR